jgi:hypothetical protein
MFMIKRMSHLAFLIVSCLLMSACQMVSPNMLGISSQQWNNYSEKEKKNIVNGYKQAQHVKNNAKATQSRADNSSLTVSIQGGKAMMPPFVEREDYKPVSFMIKAGGCQQGIPVSSVTTPVKQNRLTACYVDGILYIDSSPYDPEMALGSLELPNLPLWKRGFTYPDVSSKGRLKFSHVSITVKLIDANESK